MRRLRAYIYTNPQETFEQALNEIMARKRAAMIEANLTYFARCSEVKDLLIVFRPEFFALQEKVKKYYGPHGTLANKSRPNPLLSSESLMII